MNTNLQQTGNNTVKKEETLFCEGRKADTLGLLLKGRLSVFISSVAEDPGKYADIMAKSFRLFELDQNLFIGANDIILSGAYNLSYKAADDCSIYLTEISSPSHLLDLLSARKDYGTYIVNSLCTFIDNSLSALKKAENLKKMLKTICENLSAFFWAVKEKYCFEYTPSSAFFRNGLDILDDMHNKGVTVPFIFNRQFAETRFESETGEDTAEDILDMERIRYCQRLPNIPIELRKSFFGSDRLIAWYNIRVASECLDEILSRVKDAFCQARGYFEKLYTYEGECLYELFSKAALGIGAEDGPGNPALEALDYVVSKIRETAAAYENEYCHRCEVDLEYLEHATANIKASLSTRPAGAQESKGTAYVSEAGYDSLPDELKDSALKILDFSGIPQPRSDLFLMNLIAFRNMKDKLSTDEGARSIRNAATSVFFEIYEAVFKKAYEQQTDSRLINMFLTYGYMDEKLLSPDQVMSLYKLAGRKPSQEQVSEVRQAAVYNMKEWLGKIYGMEKEPSINEFGQDYSDIFRELKKTGHVTEKDKAQYDHNRDGKLTFEITNMFRTNHKLCHGQISVYFPVLYSGMFTRDISKALVTPERLNEILGKILDVDFSAFYREIHFKDPDRNIEKEIVSKAVYPDIVLIPIYGSRCIMWQEIAGRDRSTPGRFLLPIFTGEDLEDMLIRLVGNFRWELCRTMMGSAWNDVTQSSLTSEYTDYIQFYKKSRDLSEETKDKIKMQISKYHNKIRDIFTSDYETWLNSEAKGNIRLNKVVRAMLYRHCPFARPIREQLEKQPAYAEISAQFRNQRAKQARELENRYNRYQKTSGVLDDDLVQNLIFYRDL